MNILLNLYDFHEGWAYPTLKDIITSDFRVVIIPFSFHEQWIQDEKQRQNAYGKEYGKYYQDIVRPFHHYGISDDKIQYIDYFTDTYESAKNKIEDSQIVFFTGGLPDKMMERLIEFQLVPTLQEFKGIIMGSSAGAMIQFDEYYISPDDDYHIFGYYEGLGLVSGFGIEVHFENTQTQNDSITRFMKERQKPVYIMQNQSALIINEKGVKILGAAKKVVG